MPHPDVVRYPESGKVGGFTATPPGVPPPADQPRKSLRAAAEVGSWEGEL